MTEYVAPLRDMRFVMFELFDADALWAKFPGTAETNRELAEAVLEESAKISSGVIAPSLRTPVSASAYKLPLNTTMPMNSSQPAAFAGLSAATCALTVALVFT